MAADEFRQGEVNRLEIAGANRTAMMCAEGDCRHCHRRLLCDHLVVNDVTVQHIVPNGEVELHTLTAGARIVDRTVIYPGPPALFDM